MAATYDTTYQEPQNLRGLQEFIDLTAYTIDEAAKRHREDKIYNRKTEDQLQCCAVARRDRGGGIFVRCLNRVATHSDKQVKPRYCFFHGELFQRSMAQYKVACNNVGLTQPRYNAHVDNTISRIIEVKKELEHCLLLRLVNKFLFFLGDEEALSDSKCIYDTDHQYYLDSLQLRIDEYKDALDKLRLQNAPPVDPQRVSLVTGSIIIDPLEGSIKGITTMRIEDKKQTEQQQKRESPKKKKKKKKGNNNSHTITKKIDKATTATINEEALETAFQHNQVNVAEITDYLIAHKDVYDSVMRGVNATAGIMVVAINYLTEMFDRISTERAHQVLLSVRDQLDVEIDNALGQDFFKWDVHLFRMALDLNGLDLVGEPESGYRLRENANPDIWTIIKYKQKDSKQPDDVPVTTLQMDGIILNRCDGIIATANTISEKIANLDPTIKKYPLTIELMMTLRNIIVATPLSIALAMCRTVYDLRITAGDLDKKLSTLETNTKTFRNFSDAWVALDGINNKDHPLRSPAPVWTQIVVPRSQNQILNGIWTDLDDIYLYIMQCEKDIKQCVQTLIQLGGTSPWKFNEHLKQNAGVMLQAVGRLKSIYEMNYGDQENNKNIRFQVTKHTKAVIDTPPLMKIEAIDGFVVEYTRLYDGAYTQSGVKKHGVELVNPRLLFVFERSNQIVLQSLVEK
jgi:flagellar basal body rod protein FlgC